MAVEEQNEKELLEKKEVVFYAETVRTWYLTSMEHDKSLLTLSAGGIGLLVTLLTKFNTPPCVVRLFYVFAILSFCVCLGAVLIIFKRNRKHLEDIIKSDTTDDPLLKRLDTVAVWSFCVGIVFSSLIGIFAAISSESKTENNLSSTTEKIMAEDKKSQAGRNGTQEATASVDGASGMKPATTLKALRESVVGAAKLKPATPQSTPNQSGTTQNTKPAQGS